MNALSLCLRCRAACVAGEPACCVEPDLISISPFSSSDRRVWWNERIRAKSAPAIAAMQSLSGDRSRAWQAIQAHIDARRSKFDRFVRRRIAVPVWWEWTRSLAAAINGRIMAALVESRGGLYRAWP